MTGYQVPADKRLFCGEKPIYKGKYTTFEKYAFLSTSHENGDFSCKRKSCCHHAIFELKVDVYMGLMRTIFGTRGFGPFPRGTPWNEYLVFRFHVNNSRTTKSSAMIKNAFCRHLQGHSGSVLTLRIHPADPEIHARKVLNKRQRKKVSSCISTPASISWSVKQQDHR